MIIKLSLASLAVVALIRDKVPKIVGYFFSFFVKLMKNLDFIGRYGVVMWGLGTFVDHLAFKHLIFCFLKIDKINIEILLK